MAAIYLIRHGQASFAEADYDKLSPLGIKQSYRLGESWQLASRSCKAYSGDLLRHGQTLEYFIEGFQHKPSSIILHSGMNEFDHVDILSCYDPAWRDFSGMCAKLKQLKEAHNIFQKELSLAITRWVSGEFDSQYQESWPQFKARCIRALQDIMQRGLTDKARAKQLDSKASQDILVFTSGGTIAVIMQHILQLSDEQTLKINQQLRNTSVSKLLFSGNNISVDYFNNYSHLIPAGADWVTFR
ncbi:MAG: histidine phosphatase family protein [Colwellia sp.]